MTADNTDTPAEVVQENKSLFKRLAQNDLSIAEDAQRALELINAAREGDSE